MDQTDYPGKHPQIHPHKIHLRFRHPKISSSMLHFPETQKRMAKSQAHYHIRWSHFPKTLANPFNTPYQHHTGRLSGILTLPRRVRHLQRFKNTFPTIPTPIRRTTIRYGQRRFIRFLHISSAGQNYKGTGALPLQIHATIPIHKFLIVRICSC